MDILISSNLERLLFDLSGQNDTEIRDYMDTLSRVGQYRVSDSILSQLKHLFWGGFCDEQGTADTIAKYYKQHHYLIDTHTAVAASVLENYRASTGDQTVTVFASTASPYKFCNHVLRAIGEQPESEGVELIDQLQRVTGLKAPARLAALKGKSRRFDLCTEKNNMTNVVLDFLK
jgi:threonine synthase